MLLGVHIRHDYVVVFFLRAVPQYHLDPFLGLKDGKDRSVLVDPFWCPTDDPVDVFASDISMHRSA